METTNDKIPHEEMWQRWNKDRKRGRFFGGILLIIIGSLFFAQQLGQPIPTWVFTWPTLLIGFGFFTGFKHGFRNRSWLILILIGSAFLFSDLHPELAINRFIWPSVLIVIGLFVIFKPRRNCHSHYYRRRWRDHNYHRGNWRNRDTDDKNRDYFILNDDASSPDAIDVTSVFGSTKKNVLTKNFKGGEVTAVFSGAEVDFSQADFSGSVSLEVTAVMGSVKLIIPANWQVESHLVAIMGGVDDKRPVQPTTNDSQKKMILNGTVCMGGIEISSY